MVRDPGSGRFVAGVRKVRSATRKRPKGDTRSLDPRKVRKATKGKPIGEQVVAFGILATRTGLIVQGVLLLIASLVFLFIPIDGPVGEIAFGTLGFIFISLGIAGRSPTASEAARLGSAATKVTRRP